jgi:uncharacterized protein YjhX (UPF0386 family)
MTKQDFEKRPQVCICISRGEINVEENDNSISRRLKRKLLIASQEGTQV